MNCVTVMGKCIGIPEKKNYYDIIVNYDYDCK